MVEEDSIAGKHIVGFPVIDCYPVTVKFGDCIGAPRIKGRLLVLRGLLHQSIQFTR